MGSKLSFSFLLVLAVGLTLSLRSTNFSSRQILVVFTANDNGVLRECDCPEKPFGGLARRKTLLNQIRAEEGDFLLVDAGDFLSSMGRQRNDEYVLRAYEMMNYDGVAVGDQELLNGRKFFQKKILASKLWVVSANLNLRDTADSRLLPYFVKEVNGIKIGVVGILFPDATAYLPAVRRQEFQLESPVSVLKKILPEVRKKVDVLLLLTHGTEQEIVSLAKDFPEIDVMVAGHSETAVSDSVQMINGKPILRCGYDGEHVGKLFLRLDQNRKVESLSVRLQPIGPQLPGDPKLANFVDEYFRELKAWTQKNVMAVSQAGMFLGAEYCRQCHVVEYDIWKASPHAQATTLQKSDRGAENSAAERLAAAQCQTCHKVDVHHGEMAEEAAVPPVSSEYCFPCHHGSSFNFAESIKKIVH